VIVIHEMPGLHPGVTEFGQRVVDAGFTVYLPSLFGRPGVPFGTGALLRAHEECGGPGVGASACASPAASRSRWRSSRRSSHRL
jgi:dienelactone hydrolase